MYGEAQHLPDITKSFTERTKNPMKNSEDLRRALRAIDHKSYPAYKDLKGSYSFGNYVLSIDHVQGDPFASPSRLSILVDGKPRDFLPGFTIPAIKGLRYRTT